MRRTAIAAALSLMLVTLVGGTVSAHGGREHQPAPSFAARAGTANQGENLWVGAKEQHAVRGTAFSASAVVHFVSGDVTVPLETRADRLGHRGHHGRVQFHPRRGQSLHARAWVPVGATETPGDVPVDVTIVYGAQTVVIHTTGHVDGTVPDPGDGGPIQIG
jgi:hypothetical protein